MADLEVRSTDGNKMAMKRESATRDLSRWFPLIPPFSSLPHVPSFNFIPTALHWALSGPVFRPVFPVLRLLPPATCMGNRLISEACLHSYSTFFGLAAILLLMAVSSLMPTANLDWMHPVPEPGNLFRTDVMARDDIHVMTKIAAVTVGLPHHFHTAAVPLLQHRSKFAIASRVPLHATMHSIFY
ncbi:hypothetical protein B0H14DRAFT_3127122 [Mycena olivaceomarginata]|nr:hypothetical protein B0H14DRAFT_3127122 [Mycena olivaceomarginata]